jgi:hypothetical protein
MSVSMSTDEILAARAVFLRDQALAARHLHAVNVTVLVAWTAVATYVLLGAYAVAAVLGLAPAAPWSALG